MMRRNRKRYLSYFLFVFLLVGQSAIADRNYASHDRLPGKAVGRLVNRFGQICTAFLSGPQQITTAGHCLLGGIEGMKFQLHFRYGDKSEEVGVRLDSRNGNKGVFMMGGGASNLDQYHGTDWAHLLIDEALGLEYGWIDIYEGVADTGREIKLTAYASDWLDGRRAGESRCRVQDPPANFRRYCTRQGNSYMCNFFTLGGCDVSRRGGDSGGPLTAEIDGRHVAIGILTGRAGIGTRVFPISITVNDTVPNAANVFFHWYVLRNVYNIGIAAQNIRNKPLTVHRRRAFNVVDKIYNLVRTETSNDYYGRRVWTSSRWSRLNFAQRINEIQKWNTSRAQKSVFHISEQFRTQARAQRSNNQITFRINDMPNWLNNSWRANHQFALYYIDSHRAPYPARERPPIWRMASNLREDPDNLSQYPSNQLFQRRSREISAEIAELVYMKDNYSNLSDYVSSRRVQLRDEINDCVRLAQGRDNEVARIRREQIARMQRQQQQLTGFVTVNIGGYNYRIRVQPVRLQPVQYRLVPVRVVPVVPVQIVPVYTIRY